MGNFLLGVGATIVALGVLGYLGFRLFRRGPLTFEIDGFYSHVVDGDVGPFIRDVQADVPDAKICTLDDRMSCSIRDAVQCHNQAERPDCNVLLLSGGGQWGAYGAGLFDTLSRHSPDELALPGIGVITGISTGSLQALMLMLVGAGSVLLWHFFGADLALNGADVYQGLPALIACLVLIVIYMLWHRQRQPERELSKY